MAGSRRRTLLIVAVLVIAGAAGGIVYRMLQDDYVRSFCTLGRLIESPVASTPEGAFEAWWEAEGPDGVLAPPDLGKPVSEVDPPTRDDFEQTAEHDWEWRYDRRGSVLVSVERAEVEPGWQVVGVNICNYVPDDEQPD